MIRLNILYPNTPGSRFDMGYYLGTHMPMAKRLLGDACRRIDIEHGIAGAEPGSPAAYIVSCHMQFESIDAFMAVWADAGSQLGGDIPNYTDVQPVIQFSEPLPSPGSPWQESGSTCSETTALLQRLFFAQHDQAIQ